MNSFDFGVSNMSKCVQDIWEAQRLGGGPGDIQKFWSAYDGHYPELIQGLKDAKASLPIEYQDNIVKPLIKLLETLGPEKFQSIFTDGGSLSAKYRNYLKEVIPELAHAILTAGESANHTKAFQELVSDLYQGFLGAEARNVEGTRIRPPDQGVIPPLVKWGSPDAGPYTLPVDTVKRLGVNVAVVSMPPIYGQRGAVAWAALAHETAGHDILHADTGLISELSSKVYEAVFSQSQNKDLALYWANCIDETASDVLGILNMGPAAGIGVITYFRGIFGGGLRTTGSWDDPHPVDILRGYLAAHVVRQLKFSDREKWADRIVAETDKDLGTQKVTVYAGNSGSQTLRVSRDMAKRSAEIVAEAITGTRLLALEGHALGQIQNWQDHDDQLAVTIALGIRNRTPVPKEARGAGFYAAHVIAGATYESLRADVDLPVVFQSMITYLVSMNRENPTWMERAVRRPVVGRRVIPLRHEFRSTVVAHRVSSLTSPAVSPGLLARFTPPGGVNDGLTEAQLQAWSDEIQQYFDDAKTGNPEENDGPRHQFFVPTREAIAEDAVTKVITWTAFPRIVAVSNPGVRRFEVADRSRNMQDEYCEWSVTRDLASRKITKVTFTCEGPEYWKFLARVNPQRVLELYRQHISAEVQEADLFPNGSYVPLNKWNNSTTNGAMHLIQRNNNLYAEIELAGGASIVRAKPDGSYKVDRDELIRCSGYGAAERNSDPTIGAEVNALARLGAKVTLLNPVGLYFSDFDPQGWETPDGTDPKEFWVWTRGEENTRVRAEFMVPPEKSYTVGDIRINGRKIKYGSEITDFIHMKLVGVAQGIGQNLHPVQRCKGEQPAFGLSVGLAEGSRGSAPNFSTRMISRSVAELDIDPDSSSDPSTSSSNSGQ